MTLTGQFRAGLGGLCLGNGLLATSYALEQSVDGIVELATVGGAVLTLVGAAVILGSSVTSPEQFEFDGRTRHAATGVLVSGAVSGLAGVVAFLSVVL